jgi:penicillin-binding protein 1C
MKLRILRKIHRQGTASPRSVGARLDRVQRRLFWLRVIRIGAVASAVGVILAIIGFFTLFAYYSKDLPKPGQIVRKDGFSTKLYDRTGALLFDVYDEERRTPVTIATVPEILKQATVAVEDKDFYKHQGFDLLTVLRIPYNYIVRGKLIGGSTLTQQLVKNALLTNERSLPRKFKELILSLQIERTFTKDQILEMYFNETPYGGTAWGVGAAAEVYFSKSISELTNIEAIILAGLPQRPSAYSPFAGRTDDDGTPLWKVRTLGVLRRMKEDGYLTELSYNQALDDMEQVEFKQGAVAIKAPHFVFYVKDQLAQMYGEDVIEGAGFTVTTTLDLELQEQAQQIVADEVDKVAQLTISNGAALVMDPKTGEIWSMVGSKDYSNTEIGGQFNVVVDAFRQPGSSIKPLTYVSLLKRGYTPASMFADVETTFQASENDKPYTPRNYDGKFRGPVSVRNSLGSSLNIPAVKALAVVGVEPFLQLAYEMGFPTLAPTQENLKRFGLAVTLGGAEVHMIDTITAYSAFANGGEKIQPVSILKVQDKDGKVIYENRHVQGKRVLSAEEAFLINNILSDNSARTLAFSANSLLNVNPYVAVKTGTTNDQKDNWAVGWSRDVIVGAWVGNNDGTSMKGVASGISGATPIWRSILLAALQKEQFGFPEWEVPAGIEQIDVDAISGYPAHDGFPSKKEYVIKGNSPTLPDPIHSRLKLCRGEEKLANEARIAAGDYDEKEYAVLREADPVSQDGVNRWQEAISNWIRGQENSLYKVPTEYCGDESEIYVSLKKPENEKKYDSEEIEVEVEADSGKGIEKIELFVDGAVRETVTSRKMQSKIKLSAGQHELWAKAYSKDNKSKETGRVKIGTGGQDWQAPKPTPTPTPTPKPSPTPSPLLPSPSPSPVVIIP